MTSALKYWKHFKTIIRHKYVVLKEYNDMLSELKELTEKPTKTPVTEDIDPKFYKPVYREDIGL